MSRWAWLAALAFVTACGNSGLPLCSIDPTATRCIGTEDVPTNPQPAPTSHGLTGPDRWWENRDAGSCVSSIPVYGPGECDCNKPGPVCGDGCGPDGEVLAFCVCGGLKEEKRAATWEIPGWAQRYPAVCK